MNAQFCLSCCLLQEIEIKLIILHEETTYKYNSLINISYKLFNKFLISFSFRLSLLNDYYIINYNFLYYHKF